MSANDFLAQSTPQSIGATSIPSSESFDSQDLLAFKKVSLVPINTREFFPINSRIANAVFLYPEIIQSSENIPTDAQLNVFNARSYFEFSSSILSLETFETPVTASITNISLSGIGSTESFPNSSLNFSENILIITGISSSESVQNNNLLKHIGRLFYPDSIFIGLSFTTPSVFLARNIYPRSINSSEFITNKHLMLPFLAILAVGFIKSWVATVNSMIVNVSKKNIIDVNTLIKYQRFTQPQSTYIINSYNKTNRITVDYYEKYSVVSYIDSEQIEMARQTNDNLESYIKNKYHIESYFVSENIDISKVTRYKIEKY